MDRVRFVRGLHSRQHVEMVLVALQCKRVLLGHDGGYCTRSCISSFEGATNHSRPGTLLVASDICSLCCGLYSWNFYRSANRHGGVEEILFHRTSMGLLETGSQCSDGGGPIVCAE